MAMVMAMAKKQKKMNFGANKGTRATVIVLGGLCMPHGRVIWTYGRYTSPNHQNARLPAWVISRLINNPKLKSRLLHFAAILIPIVHYETCNDNENDKPDPHTHTPRT